MDDSFLYRRIAEDIRQEILKGKLQPGDRLPSIRMLVRQWNCTPGTIQRAYQELSRQGLVVSQAGKGTHVSDELNLGALKPLGPLRRAGMVHRAESFLLEALTLGYDLDEIQQSMTLAMDRWRALQSEEPSFDEVLTLRFSGSHDVGMVWLAAHFPEIVPGAALKLNFNGSLPGLMSLAEGKSDLSGCHLFDAATGSYNDPFIQRLFPGKPMLAVRLAERNLGWIVPPGNPLGLATIADLSRPQVRFANRQSGSGTRIWLDEALRRAGIDPAHVEGYTDEHTTHSDVARAVAEGAANSGLGLEAVAAAFGLDFVPLLVEPYDLVMPAGKAQNEPYKGLLDWLGSDAARAALSRANGYDCRHTGETRKIAYF
jgi:molybdate-binding protein/DNA-binding transcriptional regulator YhcF (GntR family)